MAEHQQDTRRMQPKPPQKTEKPASPTQENPTLRLQGLIGNQAVQRLMSQGSTKLPAGTVVQAKLTVTSADNASEHEADTVADQVVQRMNGIQRDGDEELERKPDLSVVQREGDEELERKPDLSVVQRDGDEELERQEAPESLAGSFDVDANIEQAIDSQRGKGQAMPADIQRSMEGAFGADFSGVRVHTDSESDRLNSSVGARAFTTGTDVFFREGEYQPNTTDGKRLLAHELTHTIQQNAVSRTKKGSK